MFINWSATKTDRSFRKNIEKKSYHFYIKTLLIIYLYEKNELQAYNYPGQMTFFTGSVYTSKSQCTGTQDLLTFASLYTSAVGRQNFHFCNRLRTRVMIRMLITKNMLELLIVLKSQHIGNTLSPASPTCGKDGFWLLWERANCEIMVISKINTHNFILQHTCYPSPTWPGPHHLALIVWISRMSVSVIRRGCSFASCPWHCMTVHLWCCCDYHFRKRWDFDSEIAIVMRLWIAVATQSWSLAENSSQISNYTSYNE